MYGCFIEIFLARSVGFNCSCFIGSFWVVGLIVKFVSDPLLVRYCSGVVCFGNSIIRFRVGLFFFFPSLKIALTKVYARGRIDDVGVVKGNTSEKVVDAINEGVVREGEG